VIVKRWIRKGAIRWMRNNRTGGMRKGAIDGMTKDEITGRINGSPDHEKFVFISGGARSPLKYSTQIGLH
jgi:hypothetical protein